MRDIHCPKDIGFENTFSGKDCEKEQYYNNCYHCWSTAKVKAIQELWIPINKRFPEEGKTVIASTKYDGVYPEARYTEENGWEWAYESGADYWEEIKDDVEAWMPLPKRYKPQQESEGSDK